MSARWDAIVIGAGPCGALAAGRLSRAGFAVLLVEKARFPRDKVCGGCVSAAGVELLAACGLGNLVGSWPAGRLHSIELAAGRGRAVLPLRGGVAVQRAVLDAALVQAAVCAGAEFRDSTMARVGPEHADAVAVELRSPPRIHSETARVVLVADGIGGGSLRDRGEFPVRVDPGAWLGGHVLLAGDGDLRPGVIRMAVAGSGYVGAVRLADGRANVAAALDPRFVLASGGLGRAAARVLRSAHWAVPAGLTATPWRGVPALTRRRPRRSSRRVLVAGDAAAYVEPFTGEGITWALAGGVAAAEAAGALLAGTRALAGWDRRLADLLAADQRRCWTLTRLLRHPGAVRAALAVLHRAPWLAGPLLAGLARSPCASITDLDQDHLDRQARTEGDRDASPRNAPLEQLTQDEQDRG